MRKIILTLIGLIVSLSVTYAAKAYTGTISSLQSDGSTIEVRMFGDEHFHWYTTTDGVLLTREKNNFYVASIDAEGQLIASHILAHNPNNRTNDEQQLAAAQQRDKFASYADRMLSAQPKREPIGSTTPAYFPHTGTPTAVVVLVEFADESFTVSDPAKVFDQYLNAEQLDDFGHGEQSNYGSVAQYFDDMSFGSFRPQFEVYGPVTLPHEAAYYGNNSSSTTDVNFKEFLTDAAEAANEIVDFSDSRFDSNNDGYVDLVYFIYAGYGESNGADASTIWPKSGTTQIGTFDGKTLCRYGVNNELNLYPEYYGTDTPKINGIGLFCHEFSHTLGLPDLYPTVTSACVDNQEMEYWSLMDGGEYVYYGYYPTAYTSWERDAMGWKSLESFTDDWTHLTMKPLDNGGAGYKILNPNDESEYFVTEVIENTGWNQHVPGHGLLVYHVCWPSDEVNLTQHPNNTAGKPGMAIVPADSILISSYNDNYTTRQYRNSHKGDPFPGTSKVTTLSAELNLPNFKWYNGDETVRQGLKNITEDTALGTIELDYWLDYASGIDEIKSTTSPNDVIFDLQGRQIPAGTMLSKGLYIVGKRLVVINK